MADGATRIEARATEVVTFGCRLNAVESEAIRARAAADGIADAVVFNTCAVTGEAVRQARQAIRKARRERPDARLIVTGCAAQIDPAAFAAMPEVDLVVGNDRKSSPGALSPAGPRVRVNDIMSVRETAGHLIGAMQERARAFVEVQNGCDHRCTFCIIPFGRGNSRSVPAGTVVEEVRRLARAGYAEVVLTGVDLTSWGEDLPGAPTLGQLTGRILRLVPELPRLRLSSIDAAEIDPDLMRLLAEEQRLAPYLHLSLQAGDDMILKRMKRRHSRADALALIEAVRSVRPDTAFGADLIPRSTNERRDPVDGTASPTTAGTVRRARTGRPTTMRGSYGRSTRCRSGRASARSGACSTTRPPGPRSTTRSGSHACSAPVARSGRVGRRRTPRMTVFAKPWPASIRASAGEPAC